MYIHLSAEQANFLFKNKHLCLDSETSLDFYGNELICHSKDGVFNLSSLGLNFKLRETRDLYMTDFRDLLCDHLNLSPQDLVFKYHNSEERVFDVKIANEVMSIMVCNEPNALSNTRGFYDNPEKYISDNQIGLYRRLGDSCFYFRWLDSLED